VEERNEALDCRVYAFAALVLTSPQFDKLALRMMRAAEKRRDQDGKEAEPDIFKRDINAQDLAVDKGKADDKPKREPRRRKDGFVNAWR
jgi:phage terminase large subunit GpA-like protein